MRTGERRLWIDVRAAFLFGKLTPYVMLYLSGQEFHGKD